MPFSQFSTILHEWHWCAGCVAGCLLIFLSDIYTPPGFAHGALYLLLVMMATASRSSQVVMGIATLSSLLAITGAVLTPPPDTMLLTVIANRASSLLEILLFTVMWVLLHRQFTAMTREKEKLAASQAQLQKSLAELKPAGVQGQAANNHSTTPGTTISTHPPQ